MQWIRGPENLYADLAAPDAGIEKLADLMVEWNLELICRYLRAGADAVYFADDWGAQHRLLIRPSLWRQFFKPRYARMIAPVREAGRHVFFHTDGWTCDIWDDLIDVGVTVLNPQHPLMPDDLLERRLSGQVCIRTDLDRQRVLPFGSPQEVREEVKRAVSLFGSVRGGLILHGEIGPDVPWDNIVALYEAYDEFGGSRSERT
jgi:uroporphyrinogen decarboxylase